MKFFISFIVILLLSSLTACCDDLIEKKVLIVTQKNNSNYLYRMELNGVRCVYGHSLKSHKYSVNDLIEFNTRNGKLLPVDFKLTLKEEGETSGFSPNEKKIKGFILLKKENVVINLKIESPNSKYIPYFFNGKYTVIGSTSKLGHPPY